MSLWERIVSSIKSGVSAWRAYADPAETIKRKKEERAAMYALLWHYYSNEMFDKLSQDEQLYRSNYKLYRFIRLIYNPVRRLVEFYVSSIYPGALSEDGSMLPDGIPLAIPLAKDTPDNIKVAIAQFWQWSNWQALKSVQVRYGATLGNVLIEAVDDVERGNVSVNIPWPGHVTSIKLDAAGNVKGYQLEYQTEDEEGKLYDFRKEVDGEGFRYYRNDELYSESPNVYGFVPAVWIRHISNGTDYGDPAIAGSIGKIDELNGLVSHVHDQIHKAIGSPAVMWSDGPINNLFSQQKQGKTTDYVDPPKGQEDVLMLRGPANGRVETLLGDLNLSDAAIWTDKQLAEIEQDFPELAFYKELRGMSQITGPAAARLVGDVASRVIEVAASYDLQNIKLMQMVLAIGGFRANSGAWGSLNRQQQKFLPFSLDSYERGDLDFSIVPRQIITPTKTEKAQETQAFWLGIKSAVDAGVPLEIALEEAGWTKERIAKMMKLKEEQAKRNLEMMQQASIGSTQQNKDEQTTREPDVLTNKKGTRTL